MSTKTLTDLTGLPGKTFLFQWRITMNNITDHAFVPTMDAQVTEHFEDTDTLADADGVEARNSRGAHAKDKEQTPEFVLAEFEWKPRIDKITGETHWFMSPTRSAVEALINEAPDILNAGIDLLEDEDNALARQMAKDLSNLIETIIALDTYQEDALKRHFNNQIARKAIYAIRTAKAADEWSTRVQCQGNEEPDNLTAMIERAFDDAKQVATLRSVLLQIDPKMEVNYKSAAWDIMKYLAYTNQKKYLNPDELSNRQANTHGATGTLVSRLRKHKAA
jgi:hypothetical protein